MCSLLAGDGQGVYGLPIPCSSLAYPLLFDTRVKRENTGEVAEIFLIIVSKIWIFIWDVSDGFCKGLAEREGATEVEKQKAEHEGGGEISEGKEPVTAIHKAERVCRERGERSESTTDTYGQEQVCGGASEMSVTLCETEQKSQ